MRRTKLSRMSAVALVIAAAVLIAACSADDKAAPAGNASSASAIPARGVTDTTVRIGFVYINNLNQALGTVGGTTTNVEPPDIIKAYVDAYNAKDGLGGRKIEPVLLGQDVTAGVTQAQRDAQLCTKYTEDEQVFAVVGAVTDDAVIQCLNKVGTLTLSDPFGATPDADDSEFKANASTLWSAATPSTNDAFRAMLAAIDGSDYAKDPGAKYGFVNIQSPTWQRAFTDTLEPGLTSRGITLTATAELPEAVDLDSATKAGQAAQAAIAQFKQQGINHVIMTSSAGFASLWYTTAQAQEFVPRYLITTGGGTRDFIKTDISPSLANAVFVGWNPGTDTGNLHAGPRAGDCFAPLTAAGIGDQTLPYFFTVCEDLNFLDNGLRGVKGTVSLGSFVASAESLTNLPGAWTQTIGFGPGDHTGPSTFQLATFDDACWNAAETIGQSCWKYTGSPIPFGE